MPTPFFWCVYILEAYLYKSIVESQCIQAQLLVQLHNTLIDRDK